MRFIHLFALVALVISTAPAMAAQDATRAVASPIPASGDFAGLVDIGGRSIYLECQGTGGPTIILIGGYRSSSMYWTDDLLQPESPRTMVLPGVAKATRVCAYDRPGTTASIGDEDFISRSDPIAQPRTSDEVVEELHALLQSAGIPGPYVLAGHSMGGFFARHYAATYPDEVVGLVLVDAYSEMLEDVMPPDRWQALVQLNQGLGTDTVVQIPGYGELETLPWGADNAVVRAAVAAHPLPPMPLAVLAHGKPFAVSEDSQGFSAAELESYIQAANESKSMLVPDTRYWVASESGHDIHQDQPELVIEAIQQVLEGVRSPDTWYDLRLCCNG
jgi:pimeloyl-ACP methyl ester carboxylesterase